MKPLKPIHTFWLTLFTVVILFCISLYEPKADALFSFKPIDIISSLRLETQLLSDDNYDDVEPLTERGGVEPEEAAQMVAVEIQRSEKEAAPKELSDTTTATATATAAATIESQGEEGEMEEGISIKEQTKEGAKVLNMEQTLAAPQINTNPYAGKPHSNIDTTVRGAKAEPKAQPQQQNRAVAAQIENSEAIASFLNKLRNVNSLGRPLRIAVLGDSFIEGDIFTQDVREKFQSKFGGAGVGFVPMETNISGFRQTVKHTFSGWTTRRISRNVGSDDYTISSHTYTPGDGTVSRYAGSKSRKHIQSFSRARLMFVNRGTTKIHTQLNNEPPATHSPAPSANLQQITILTDSIGSVEFSFTSTDNFTAYGVYLDGKSGVSVDNYSVRGNSGVTLSATNLNLMSQMNSLMPVDLIVIEYGLNIVQADNRNYKKYTEQIKKAIHHLQQAFPHADFLIMSVPDRAHLTAGGWQTMPGITAMEQAQRELSQECSVAFWSTLQSMQSHGGMGNFVKNGWAAKDYTHLSHQGGRVLARSFFDAIMQKYYEE